MLVAVVAIAATPSNAQEGFHLQFGVGAGLFTTSSTFDALPQIPNPGGINFASTNTPIVPQVYVGGDMPIADSCPSVMGHCSQGA